MLEDLGWDHVADHSADGLYVDLADPESKTAVEVFACGDYFRDLDTGDSVLDGFRRCKIRLLENMGWRVAQVPYFDWERTSDRPRFLRENALHHIGGASPAPPPLLDPRLQALHDLL